jgi:alcohol dehydrogenase
MVLEAPRRLVRRDLPVPDVGDDDAVLRVEACGLCGTDHEQYTGLLPGPGPFVPGHETVGVIERIGPEAAARWGVGEGDRVAVEVFQSCGTCDECTGGEYRRCREHGIGDMYGFVGVDRAPGLWGGYATHQYLAPHSLVLPVPDTLDPVLATLFNPVGAGIRWGVTVPGTAEGDVVAVLGPGIRGLSVVAAAREAGAGFVLVTGAGVRDAERLEAAKALGADLTVDVTTTDPARALREATGAQLARVGGTVVVAGTRGVAETPGFHPDHVVYKELRLIGALGVDAPAYRAALELLASGRYPFAGLAREVVGLDGLDHLLRRLSGEADGDRPVHAVVVPS